MARGLVSQRKKSDGLRAIDIADTDLFLLDRSMTTTSRAHTPISIDIADTHFSQLLQADRRSARSALHQRIQFGPAEAEVRSIRRPPGRERDVRGRKGDRQVSRSDIAKLHAEFRNLFDRFETLTSRAQTFMRNLQSTIDLQGMTAEQFLDYKEMLIEYLERFLSELVLATSEISERLGGMASLDGVLAEVSRHALADVLDPTPEMHHDERDRWLGKWKGFRRWFLGSADGGSQAEILRRKAREAIPALLYTLSAIHDRRVSRSDRLTDWKTLALWFAEAPDDEAAHRLWRGAFALAPVRVNPSLCHTIISALAR